MFPAVRSDTLVRTIEARYGIDLHARRNMKLGNLLDERGFDSLSQLLEAYHRRLTYHPRKRRLFFSFHCEDLGRVRAFRNMPYLLNSDIDFNDCSVRVPINSENGSYIKQQIAEKIRQVSVVVCLIGSGTAWREWVDWELRKGIDLGKGICGIRLKGSRGRTPPLLDELNAPVAKWKMDDLIPTIECAAARRS
jgi:hypothetical protein